MCLDFTGRWSRKAGVTCSSLAHQPCEEPGLSDTDLGNYQYKKTLLTSTIPTFLPVPGCPEPTRRCVFGAASLPSPLHPCRPLEGNISLKPETSSSAGMALSSASLRSAVLPYAQQRFLAWGELQHFDSYWQSEILINSHMGKSGARAIRHSGTTKQPAGRERSWGCLTAFSCMHPQDFGVKSHFKTWNRHSETYKCAWKMSKA